ncbi:magnesium-translocating P-type ATPase [Williamsoniiplasma luminosum]|uniref:Magnesium-transporting ATPase, P-type 1 n=1 Tax=Williamsoniiplasma luminosum TaxID=214888 RepID=A0A2S0NK64_9MOLU|nr:magnesium-translocating P-type ATPase [Williamsoniiplasma luminosum]AVP49395.1 MAG: magnesium-translocating P-type ATPase [Williamsoniiplasma luminosum]
MIKFKKNTLISKVKEKQGPTFENEKLIRKMVEADQEEVKKILGLKHFGLTNNEYRDRIEKYGTNELKKHRFNWILEIGKAFFSPFSLILLAIAAYYFITFITYQFGTTNERSIFDVTGAIVILAMVFASGTMTFVQALRSYLITKKIGSIVKNTTDIIRHKNNDNLASFKKIDQDNQLDLIKLGEEINAKELVPGDLIYLSSGDMIPADVRILNSKDLFINQSSLTGESVPVEKHATNSKKTNNILEFENICYTGTSVVSGSGIAIAIATGDGTYFATINKTIMEKRPEGSFSTGVKKVTRVLLILMLVMVPIVYLINAGVGYAHWDQIGGFTKNPWFKAIFFAVAVAVGLTPEMLPMIVSTNLANGAGRMAKGKVVVKKLDAIQSLGAIDILATDKTGTLTNDKIELVEYLTVDKQKDPRLLKYLYLNSYFQTGIKNPMDKAIVDYVSTHKLNFDLHTYQKIDEIPFDFNRRKLTVIFNSDEEKILVTKGSMEEILSVSTKVYYQGKIQKITDAIRAQIQAYFEKINNEGKRVLGVAYKPVDQNQNRFSPEDENELIFFGFATFLDTPKPSTKKMIKLLHKYGVELKILTGDNEQVTRAICKMVHLDIKGLVTGEQLDSAGSHEIQAMVEQANIFVKLNPLQKVKVIQILKQNGHIVGFMGDGINDAPVLRQSDVGISVNNASDIAKDASDIILLEKSLLVLEKGIIQGRTIFANILKYIKVTTSSNFGNVLSVIVASAILPFLPMLPVQMLFQNLIYDLSQFAMALDRVDEEFVQKPQRWKSNDLVPFVCINGPVSSVFDILTFVIVGFGFGLVPEFNAMANKESFEATQIIAQFNASWFLIGLITQTMVMQVLRTEKLPFIQSRSPWIVYLTMVMVISLAFSITFTPFGTLLHMTPPIPVFIGIAAGLICGYLCLAQLVKMTYIKIFKKWL